MRQALRYTPHDVSSFGMDYESRGKAASNHVSDSHVSDEDRKSIVQALSLEYQTLREETLVRTSGRFQFLGLMTTAAALLTTGIFSSSVFKSQVWISAILAALVFAAGVICFVYLGRQRELVLIKIAAIENRVNALLPAEPGFSTVLSLESNRVHWTLYQKVKLVLLGARAF
jgi:hypothetical protein